MKPRGEGPGIARILRGDPLYPAALLDLRDSPDQLYLLGNMAALEAAPNRVVAIVGTRDASPYGIRVANGLARAFARAGIAVISGLARGVDSAAHRGALEAGGSTIAVMGTGVDVPYPVGNRGLHSEIASNGLVVSESDPGSPAIRGCFPRRNRIIAALARVTIVVEAPYKSGAINTATQALELGRTVGAVPGPIDSPRSAGANLLLRDGAQVIGGVDDALGLFGEVRRRGTASAALGTLESAVLQALLAGSASPHELGTRAGLPLRRVLEGVARLELEGLVHQTTNGDVALATLESVPVMPEVIS